MKIYAIVDTHQDIIGYDAPLISRILPDHNEHGAIEGHEKAEFENSAESDTTRPPPIRLGGPSQPKIAELTESGPSRTRSGSTRRP